MRNQLLGVVAACGLAACSSKVSSNDLSGNSVNTPAIADRSVTNPKLADGAVDTRTLASGSVGTEQLASGAVGTAQLAPEAVGTAQLAPGAVTADQLAPNAAVLGLNGMTGNVTLAAGANLALASSAGTITVSLQGPVDAATLDGSDPSAFLQLAGNQTVSGSPTFSGAPAFTGSGGPFTVSSSQKVSNLNADQLDGLDSSAFAQKVSNVIWVAQSGGDFTSIQAAINSVSGATAANRYLIRIAPGAYNESITMKAYVDLQGSGERQTLIKALGSTPIGLNAATDAEVRDLTVEALGKMDAAAVLLSAGTSTSFRHVHIVSSAPSESYGIFASGGGTVDLDHVTVEARDGTSGIATAITATQDGTLDVTARDSIIKSQGRTTIAADGEYLNTEIEGTVMGTNACLNCYRVPSSTTSISFTARTSTCQ